MAETLVDLVARKVTEQFNGALGQLTAEAEAARKRGEEAVARMEEEGRARMDEFFSNLPSEQVFGEVREVDVDGDFDPIEWIRRQATSRALRTLAQGLIAAVLVSFSTAVIQAVTVPGFDILSLSDWKLALVLGVGAVGTAVVGFVQNKLGIKPPKVL